MTSLRRSPRRRGASSPERRAPAVPAATTRIFLAGVTLQSLGRGGQALAAFFTILILAAALDAPALGLFGVYEAVFALVEVMVDGGSGNALVRRAGARPESLRPTLRLALRFRAATGILGAAVVLGYTAFDPLVPASHPGLLICVLALASHLATTRTAVYHLKLRFGLPSIVRFATALAVLAVVASMVAAGATDPIWLLAGAQATRAAGNLALGAFAGRQLREWPRHGASDPGFVRECLALGAGGLVREGYGRIDLILVRALLGTAAAGLYTPVRKAFNLALQLPSFIGIIAMPALAARAADNTSLRADCFRMARRLTLFSVPAALVAMPLAPPFVDLALGPAFAETVLPLRILAWAAALVFPGSILTTGMVAQGAARAALLLALTVLAITALANLALLPLCGLAGAAIARLLAEAAALTGAWGYFRARP
ncbi:MAG: oligosaccharide flippase family protein [Planctomycetes bacterium]|nr:oligosaccharide flippase family protein [Planctomycetota bacterium]